MILTDPALLLVVTPVLLLAFYHARQLAGRSAALLVLFASSLLVYAPFGPVNLALLCASTIFNASVAIFLETRRQSRLRALIFYAGQLCNLGFLLWFKYSIFYELYAAWHGEHSSPVTWLIPMGISFYTFQQAAMLADIYRREPAAVALLGDLRTLSQRAAALVRYGFVVTFFPHLVIGPIVYIREIQPQLASSTFGVLRQRDLFVGLFLIGVGLFKKLVVADNLAPSSDIIFQQAASGLQMNTESAWLGAFSYYFQLYFDFSAYSDVALGLARLFGLIFPINFYSPLKAVGIVDYYRRWHMTLTRAISRFLFSPLALIGARIGSGRSLPPVLTSLLSLWLPLWLNFVVIGLWHGGLWTFVLFGTVHGVWYVVEVEVRRTRRWKAFRRSTSDRLRRLLGRCLFLLPMVLSLAIFRSESVPAYGHLLHELFAIDLAPARAMPGRTSLAWILFAAIIVYALPNAMELLSRYRPGFLTYKNESYGPTMAARPNIAWTIFWLALVLSAFYFIARQPPFLYMGY